MMRLSWLRNRFRSAMTDGISCMSRSERRKRKIEIALSRPIQDSKRRLRTEIETCGVSHHLKSSAFWAFVGPDLIDSSAL